MDKQFVIPILLGISLSTVSCVSLSMLLYSMFRKDDETKDDSDEQTILSSSITAHYEVPKELISAIIGIDGVIKRAIEIESGTHIHFDKKDGSPDYICIVKGNEADGIRLAELLIKNTLEIQPIIHAYELIELNRVCKKIGLLNKFRNKDIVQQIQKSSGATIILDYAAYKIEGRWRSKIKITGNLNQIGYAINQLEDKFYEVKYQAHMKHKREANIRMLTSSVNKNIENEIEDKIEDKIEGKIDDETNDETDDETYNVLYDELNDKRKNKIDDLENKIRVQIDDEIDNAIDDDFLQETGISKITSSSVPYKVWEEFIEKSGKTIEQIKKDFRDVEIIIKEDPISPDNNKVTLQGYLTAVTEAMRQIRDKVKGLDQKKSDQVISKVFLQIDQKRIEVFVSAVETPHKFWIQKIGPGNAALNNLVSEMTKYYNEAENRVLHKKKIKLYQIVAAKFSHDNKWYRAQVLSLGNFDCKVFYVDYGNVETIPINDVLELRTDMLCLELQAIECSLANIEPRENEWTAEAWLKFADLTHVRQEKPLIARIEQYIYPRSKLPDSDNTKSYYFCRSVPLLELYEKTDDKIINIRKTLIHLELAKKKKVLNHTNLL
ncbi:tudor and KH domain-containing protein homolog isoform X3 [Camponotus floridanus]|uniref:tudor and KH domain-containing protein homolog isoform X3 n=1 Tax=Camponotus floridanus TaxID=104421 RepID=UPI000DC69420|nr:tudor and KH domain-containing protein homolog isoform X3 [Camponotus floridanus]